MSYHFTKLEQLLVINHIISIHYFEYMSDFIFHGESHDFWELLYVDKGQVQIVAGESTFLLKKGDVIFHQPNEFHAVHADGIIAPNLAVIGFECDSPFMDFFKEKSLVLPETERNLLAQIISEAKNCFSSPLDNPYQEQLERKKDSPFASEQMIKICLEQLLIQLFRSGNLYQSNTSMLQTGNSDSLYESLITYFEHHTNCNLSLEQICKENLISHAQLKKLFRKRHNCGPISYFTTMRIDMAKQLIRSQQMNITQVADHLGYTSIHYFSRQFKKETGMTPTEYMSSIKQRTEASGYYT